jgi:hypothetical protein
LRSPGVFWQLKTEVFGPRARDRVMDGYRIRQIVVLAATILCATLMIPGCASQKSVTPSEVDEVEIKTTDPLGLFAEEYDAINRKVEEGFLPAEALRRAAEIRIGLKKYLIKTEAQLEILGVDLLHGDDYETRQTALQEMLALAAERERTKMAYLQRLQALNTANPAGEKTKSNGKVRDIEIEIGPEDITEGERP